MKHSTVWIERALSGTSLLLLLTSAVLLVALSGCAGSWVYEEDRTWVSLGKSGLYKNETAFGTTCYMNARGFMSCVRDRVDCDGIPPVITLRSECEECEAVPPADIETDDDGVSVRVPR